MKKIFNFFLLLAFLLPLCLSAQGFGGGISLGTVMAQWDGDNYGGYKKIGLHFGGFVYYDFKPRWGIQPEILFVQRGSREVSDLGLDHYKFNYIDVPVYLNFIILRKEDVKFTVQAGPQVGVLLFAREGRKPFIDDVTNVFRRYDMGFSLGFEVHFLKHFGFIFRHNNSFISISPGGRPFWAHRYFSVAIRGVLPK